VRLCGLTELYWPAAFIFIHLPWRQKQQFLFVFFKIFQPYFSWFAVEMFCKWLFNKMLSHALTTLCVTYIANWQPYNCSTDILVWVALHNQAYVFLCSDQKLKRSLIFLRNDMPDDLPNIFFLEWGGFSWTVDTELPPIHDMVYVSVPRIWSQKYICWLKCSNYQNLVPTPNASVVKIE